VLLADAGYCSKDNIEATAELATDVLVATGRLKHNENAPDAPRGRIPKSATTRERMARRLRTKSGRAHYARRKAIVEPVFGQMKTRQRAGHLRLRGLEGARGEWLLHALCHNLRSSPTPIRDSRWRNGLRWCRFAHFQAICSGPERLAMTASPASGV